jgi:MFS family permease
MGVLLAINSAAQMGFMYLFGRVADGWGRKPLIVAGMAGAGAHALVMAAAVLPGTVPLRAVVAGGGLFVLAAAYSAETTGTYAFIGDIAPTTRESELMGLHSTFRGFGGMAGPALIGSLATVTSFETAFAAASLLAFGGTGLVAWRLVESYGDPDVPPGVAPEG